MTIRLYVSGPISNDDPAQVNANLAAAARRIGVLLRQQKRA